VKTLARYIPVGQQLYLYVLFMVAQIVNRWPKAHPRFHVYALYKFTSTLTWHRMWLVILAQVFW